MIATKPPKSCNRKLLSHPSVLRLTTVQHIFFLEPTLWTGQAGRAGTFKSGMDIILVGNHKGYNKYYTADTCNVQLKFAQYTPGFQDDKDQNLILTMQKAAAAATKSRDSACAKSSEKDTRSQGSVTDPPPRRRGDIVTIWMHACNYAKNLIQGMLSQKLNGK